MRKTNLKFKQALSGEKNVIVFLMSAGGSFFVLGDNMAHINLIGLRFGRLLVIEKGQKQYHYLCQCDCGVEKEIRQYELLNGKTKSCGCLYTTHGMYGIAEYTAWANMKGRCNNHKDKNFIGYGGRGITVCDRWDKFENFYADMGARPKGLTLERIDNNGNYEPSNCKWATRKEQNRNTRRSHMITYNGITKCIADWAEECGVHWSAMYRRLSKHTIAKALNMQKKNNRGGYD